MGLSAPIHISHDLRAMSFCLVTLFPAAGLLVRSGPAPPRHFGAGGRLGLCSVAEASSKDFPCPWPTVSSGTSTNGCEKVLPRSIFEICFTETDAECEML